MNYKVKKIFTQQSATKLRNFKYVWIYKLNHQIRINETAVVIFLKSILCDGIFKKIEFYLKKHQSLI